jgi:hypothetical protein
MRRSSGLLAVYAVALFDTAALTAASVVFSGNGSALKAAHFWQLPGWPAPPKVSKRSCPLHLGLAALDFPRSIIAPGARPDAARRRRVILGPSRFSARASCFALPPVSMQSSRHACRSTPYATIPLGLLMGRFASSVRLRIEKQEHVTVMFGSGGFEHPGGQASRCPPYALAAIHKSPKQCGPRIPSGGRNLAKRSNSRRLARRVSAVNQVTRRGAK